MIYHSVEQGSDAWLAARRGVITASRFKDARDRLADKAEKVCKKTGAITPAVRGGPSAKCLKYAYDLARERCGGAPPGVFVTKAMQAGTEGEPLARMAYEVRTGELVREVGFYTDDDAIFGVSVDGIVGDDGAIEIKTMVSSETLFTAVVHEDDGEYIDQINGAMWVLGLKWVDLVLWAPDLDLLAIRRIHRDENAIEALQADLLAFAAMVRENEAALRLAVEKQNPKEEVMKELRIEALVEKVIAETPPLTSDAAPAPATPPPRPAAHAAPGSNC